jgi:nitroreductase
VFPNAQDSNLDGRADAATQIGSVEAAIRTRRTHKAFGSTPISREVLLELFELARWAPNHHLTNPWRFRVLGPCSRQLLASAAERAKPGSSRKLERAPTLIIATARLSGDQTQQAEDLLAAAIAAYLVLLGAHARGLAGYWRTVAALESPSLRSSLGISTDEHTLGLLHLGYPVQAQRVPERAPVEDVASFLP